MTNPKHPEHNEEGLSKSLSGSLSDGIFAISMTLLVLDLKIPKIAHQIMTQGLVPQMLADLWPKFVAYFTSFIFLGFFWVAHHGYAHFLKRTDRWYLWINLIFLMFITLVPFSTNLLGDFPTDRSAVIFYGSNFIAIGLSLYSEWWYATSGHRLVGRDVEPELIRKGKIRIAMGIVLFSISILIAFINPVFSLFLYCLFPIIYLIPSQLDQHWTHSH